MVWLLSGPLGSSSICFCFISCFDIDGYVCFKLTQIRTSGDFMTTAVVFCGPHHGFIASFCITILMLLFAPKMLNWFHIYIYITEVDAYHFPPTIFGVIFEDFFATKLGTQTFLPNIKMTGYRIHGTFWILHRDRLFPCHIYADSWLSWKEMIGMLCEYDSGFQRPKIEHYWN